MGGPYDARHHMSTLYGYEGVCVCTHEAQWLCQGVIAIWEGGSDDSGLLPFIVGGQTWRFLGEYWEFRESAPRCMHVMMWWMSVWSIAKSTM